MAGSFESMYQGVPPWDIGRPQKEFVALEAAGEIRGSVLDVGCGTGENALYLAGRGHPVLGVDAAPTAIRKAKAKARGRKIKTTFTLHDALRLDTLERTFDTVIDSGLFHVFDDEDRVAFTRSLASVIPPAGRYYMMCFSEREPGDWGPRRVAQAEIRAAFGRGWRVEWIRDARFETNEHGTVKAWLSRIERR